MGSTRTESFITGCIKTGFLTTGYIGITFIKTWIKLGPQTPCRKLYVQKEVSIHSDRIHQDKEIPAYTRTRYVMHNPATRRARHCACVLSKVLPSFQLSDVGGGVVAATHRQLRQPSWYQADHTDSRKLVALGPYRPRTGNQAVGSMMHAATTSWTSYSRGHLSEGKMGSPCLVNWSVWSLHLDTRNGNVSNIKWWPCS